MTFEKKILNIDLIYKKKLAKILDSNLEIGKQVSHASLFIVS